MVGNNTISRRTFLKRATTTSLVGLAGLTAGAGMASAANDYKLTIADNASYGTRISEYTITIASGTIEAGPYTEAPDSGGSYATGAIQGDGTDTYWHSGNITGITVNDDNDDIATYTFPDTSGTDLLEVSYDAPGSLLGYTVSATGSLNKGPLADDGGTGADTDNGNTVQGKIMHGGKDSYYYTGTIDHINSHPLEFDIYSNT